MKFPVTDHILLSGRTFIPCLYPFAFHVQGYILNQEEIIIIIIIIIISHFTTTIKTAKASTCCLNSAWINVVDEVCLHTTFKPFQPFMAVSTDYPRVFTTKTYNAFNFLVLTFGIFPLFPSSST
jgi:hypothetical protein